MRGLGRSIGTLDLRNRGSRLQPGMWTLAGMVAKSYHFGLVAKPSHLYMFLCVACGCESAVLELGARESYLTNRGPLKVPMMHRSRSCSFARGRRWLKAWRPKEPTFVAQDQGSGRLTVLSDAVSDALCCCVKLVAKVSGPPVLVVISFPNLSLRRRGVQPEVHMASRNSL